LPPLKRFDPEGYYARLGLDPSAAPDAVAAAYRTKARVLHPDVPGSGDTAAFVAVKQAYDVLANPRSRAEYDRMARRLDLEAIEPGEIPPPRRAPIPPTPTRYPRPSDMPIAVWLVLGAVLVVGIVQVVRHLTVLPPLPRRPEVPALAASVAPATPEQARAAAFGPTPLRLAGIPNFYVVPAAGSTVLWRRDEAHDGFLPSGQLPPFSAVQGLRLLRQNGLMEVRITDQATGFVETARLTPGDATAAHSAYCAYNAGPSPGNGEVLQHRGVGKGRLELDNRTTQPVVVKLRDRSGAAVVTAFLAPSAHAEVEGLPEGRYRPDFAIGELWSRACQRFAAGMRAQRLSGYFSLEALMPLTIPPDLPGEPPPADISDQAFERE
jgi:hypothetical protein